MTTQSHHDAIKNKVLTGNNALRVHMYLKANETDRRYRLPRWIWELLQNARDASTVFNIQLETEIKYSQEELIFLHNGSRFAEEQIAHLIFHGSTKIEDEETIGQYGSGFLTTHLLSPVIRVSGQLDDGRYFNFCLRRKPDSPDAVRESMDQAWDDYTHSLSDEKPPIPEPFTTQFVYPIINEDAQEAVDAGLKTLEQCAPFVVAFNQNFLRIHIERSGEAQSFEVDKRTPLDHDGFYEIVVTENRDGSCRKGKYLLAEGDQGSVTVPLESNGKCSVCLSVENTPRLFKEFPLVGTESFSFPAVINSLNFATKEERDGIRLGLNDADQETLENQSVIEEACALLVRLLGYAASSGWHHTHRWAKIPTIQDEKWVDEKWLRGCITSRFLEGVLQTPVVLNKTHNAMRTTESKLPIAESDEGIYTLFGLLEGWREYSEKLPRQQEAIEWCETLKSWVNVLEWEDLPFTDEMEALRLYGAIDGRGLALHLEEKTKNSQGWGRIEILQRLLHPHVCEIQWIDEFCGFLRDSGFDNVIREHRIVPDQEGFFRKLPILKRDLGIDKDLMEIDELLNLRSKGLLRDTRITSLAEERGDGDADNEFILERLIKELQERSENNPDNNFKKASAQLFAWIVHQDQNNWNLLRNVPVFTEDSNTHYSLSSASPTNNTLLLAPIRAWPEDLQQFSDLFPPNRILDDTFFEVLPDTNTWQMLDEEAQLIRQNMIVHFCSKNLNQFSPEIYMDDDDTGKHEAMNPFPATAIVAWTDIMDRVTDSSGRGRLFWKFLTEWLIKKDVTALETKEAECTLCGQNITHKYYPAAWLEAVRKNKWIRQGNPRVPADEKSLANLLKDSEDIQNSLDENSAVVKLLKAMDLNFSVLKLELVVAGNEEKRNEVFDVATTVYSRPRLTQYIQENENLTQDLEELLDENQGDVSQLKLVSQDFKDDKKLPKLLEDRRKHRQKWRDNQDLGAEVEKLVKENLEQAGFSVKRTGTGSDFEIAEDTDDITQLEIEGGVQSWLVEVKSTRTENDYQYVRMTSTQAETAVKVKEGFLLCVVPLGQENPTPEIVKKSMRFIQNMGDRLTQLCENLNSLEDWRDKITADDTSGVQLIIEAGKAGILVQKSVWESDEAVPLEKLAEYLR